MTVVDGVALEYSQGLESGGKLPMKSAAKSSKRSSIRSNDGERGICCKRGLCLIDKELLSDCRLKI
jgi:hypothetical protein